MTDVRSSSLPKPQFDFCAPPIKGVVVAVDRTIDIVTRLVVVELLNALLEVTSLPPTAMTGTSMTVPFVVVVACAADNVLAGRSL